MAELPEATLSADSPVLAMAVADSTEAEASTVVAAAFTAVAEATAVAIDSSHEVIKHERKNNEYDEPIRNASASVPRDLGN